MTVSENGFKTENVIRRDTWGKQIEFLLSCIAMSIGLGNIWRFPFTALENGGGAFVIPYIVVLFLVGKPIYFMEMVIGQFSSRGSVKVYDFCPIMRGVGFSQTLSLAVAATYYSALISIIFKYFFDSFSSILPWSYCKESWKENCVPSAFSERNESISSNYERNNLSTSSAELYFIKDVLKENPNGISDGIGLPDPELTGYLILSWSIVFCIVIKGIRSSGKLSYFFVILPYLTLAVLLVRSLTLPGAMDGVWFFLAPRWEMMLNAKVWYSAVTQAFFSLSVSFSNIIMYASYNQFDHNIHRDVTIVTCLDTLTSLIAGCSIFGTLGNLAHELGTTNLSLVVKEESGLAFVSYPDALSKFTFLPQFFSAAFFFMLLTLGIGTNIAQTNCFMTVIRDKFPKVKHWQAVLISALIGICLGSIYLTPGGQYVLKLVDFYGCSFVVLILAIAELVSISWIYGVPRLCKDIEFMLGFRPNSYWRLCWTYITPCVMIFIFFYTVLNYENITYGGHYYPEFVYTIGWCISGFGLMQIPIFAFYTVSQQKGTTVLEKIRNAIKPASNWGPVDPTKNSEYKNFLENKVQLTITTS